MANALRGTLVSLTYEGTDLRRSDLSVHLDVVSGLNDGLTVRGEDTTIPGMDGRVARNRKKDTRTVLLAGFLQGIGSGEDGRLAAYQNLRDEMEALFDLTLVGTLVGQAADGTWREIDARPELIVWDPAPVNGVGTISVTFISVEPDWQITGGGS